MTWEQRDERRGAKFRPSEAGLSEASGLRMIAWRLDRRSVKRWLRSDFPVGILEMSECSIRFTALRQDQQTVAVSLDAVKSVKFPRFGAYLQVCTPEGSHMFAFARLGGCERLAGDEESLGRTALKLVDLVDNALVAAEAFRGWMASRRQAQTWRQAFARRLVGDSSQSQRSPACGETETARRIDNQQSRAT